MKKRFLLISMFAAAMLATSCSKDDNGVIQTVEPQPVTIQVQKTYPITVKATKKSSVSKISLGLDGYSELFDKDDKLVLTWGTDVSVELPLTNGDGTTSATFSGEIPVTAEGQDITAHIGSPIDATTKLDYTSLKDAVKNVCYLVSHGSFTYKAGADIPQITLDDQNSYLHFKLASTQLKFDLNIDGTNHTFSSFGANNEVWIVVPGGKTIKGNMISVSGKSLNAAKVYTVDRTDVVDLGLSNNTLWKTSNESNNELVTYANISIPDGYRLPSKDELKEFTSMSYTIQDHVYSFTTEYGSISFPLLGHKNASGVLNQSNQVGYYWSSDEAGEEKAFDLVLVTNIMHDHEDRRIESHDKTLSFSVRAVRRL